jgi:subtilisin family serine protease
MHKYLSGLLLVFLLSFPAAERVIPNDPLFKLQYSFNNPGGKLVIDSYSYKPSAKEYDAVKGIDPDMTRAWAVTTGKKDVVVALLADGFFYQHEDIKDNIWKNPGESGLDKNGYPKETNGIDDDGNGYVDDVMGWDFAFDDPDPDPYIFDGMDATKIQPYWHSISAMGIIGAKGNNGIGVAGINWDVSMMLLKIGAQGIRGIDLNRCERAAKAIRYAADNGVRVINWSGFVQDLRPESLALLESAIDYAGEKGVLLVVGVGNDGKNVDLKENFTYPVSFENENILTVAEIDFKGDLYRYKIDGRVLGSSYGEKNVDIAAIGMNFTTFLKNNRSVYALAGGTSNSTPVVTGVAALGLAIRPELKVLELKKILMDSATPLPSLKGKIKSGGMVNAYQAIQLVRNERR